MHCSLMQPIFRGCSPREVPLHHSTITQCHVQMAAKERRIAQLESEAVRAPPVHGTPNRSVWPSDLTHSTSAGVCMLASLLALLLICTRLYGACASSESVHTSEEKHRFRSVTFSAAGTVN